VLLAQATEQAGAAPYEKTDERTCYRDSYRDRPLTTRIGTLTMQVSRLRYRNFSTVMFERYQCREQALALAMMETVVNGVSARKAELITEELSSNLVTNQIWALFI